MSSVRFLTYLIFAYTTVEGLVINVMYPNTLPFIFKDFAIAAAYFALATEAKGSSGSLSKLSLPAMVFGGVTCFYLLLPSQVSLLGELVAVKQRLFYIPLAWVAYHFLRDERDFLGLMKAMAWTAIPASIFGIYLYFVGPVGLTSLGANYSALIGSTSGEHHISFWRVPGTFTSPGQYGAFLLFNAVLFVGVLFEKGADRSQRVLTLVALIAALGALLVSGSRSPLLLFVMCSVGLLAVTGKLKGIGVWAGGLYGVLTMGFTYFGGGVQDRVGSIASWDNVERFNDTYFGQLFWPLLFQEPMGFGLGRATIGARHFTDWANIMLVESYFGIIVAETGVIGLAAFAWLTAAVIVAIVRCRSAMRDAPTKVLWWASALLVLTSALLLPVSTGLDAAPGNLYFWFFLGAAIKMHDLEVARRQFGRAPGAPWQPAGAAIYPVPPSYQ